MSRPSEKPYTRYHAGRVRRARPETPPGAPDRGQGPPGRLADVLEDPVGPAKRGKVVAPAARSRATANGDAPSVPAPGPQTRRHRRFHWWYLSAIPLALLVAVGVWAVIGYSVFDSAVAKSNHRITKATRAALVDPHGGLLSTPSTTLILGSDQRGKGPARSDTIMLLRFDPRTHAVSQLSIPRDTLVDIPGHGQGKINEAYFWGGAPLAINVISSFTGVPINHIMLVNFRGFPDLINSVGGVTVTVPKDITSWYSGNITVHFKKGPQLMTGKQALIYSRIRYVDNDFFRMGRQQQVVQALEKKITRPGNVPRLPWIGKEFMKGVGTDLSTNQLIELAYLQWRAKPAQQYRWVMPGTPQMIGGGSYVIVDPAVRARLVARFLAK